MSVPITLFVTDPLRSFLGGLRKKSYSDVEEHVQSEVTEQSQRRAELHLGEERVKRLKAVLGATRTDDEGED